MFTPDSLPMIPELFPMRTVYLQGITHELDPSGARCEACGEWVDYLLESGGVGAY